MKINDIAKGSRPRYATFGAIGANCTGIIATKPEWKPDEYSPGRHVLVVTIQTADGTPCSVYMRSEQMRESLRDSVFASGEPEVEVGGRLSVTYIADRGRMKVYEVKYTAPQVPRPRPAWGMSQDSTGARSFSEPIYSREYED